MERSIASRGQVLPLVALLVVVLLGFAALAVDVGYDRYAKRVQQSAADSAATAGAIELLSGKSNAVASARHDASKNGFTDDTSGGSCTVCVTINIPPKSGSYTGDSSAVEAIVSAPHPSFFGRALGSSNVTISARAVARLRSDDNGCLYALDPSQGTNMNGATVSAPGCSVFINGNVNLNSATVTAQTIGIGDIAGSNTGGTFPSAQPTSMPALVSDPCLQIPGCAYLTYNPPSTSGCIPFPGTAYATQGCYSSWSSSGTVTLNPGVYVIDGSMDIGKGTINGNGVTIYVTNKGSLNFNKGTFNLTAPTTGDTANVLFFGATVGDPNFNKTGSAFTGVVYFPKACPNLNKNGGGYAVFILACANFNKSTMTFSGPGAGGSYVKTPVLAE